MPQPAPKFIAVVQGALAHHQAGRLGEARKLYEQALRVQPKNHELLNLLGLIVAAQEGADQGMRLIRRALAYVPHYPEGLNNLGVLLLNSERLAEALASFDKAVALKPDYAEAHNNRGNVLHRLDRDAEALASCDTAIALRPNYAEAFNNRGIALHGLGRDVEAVATYEKAIALRPGFAEAFNNLGVTLHRLKRDEAALVCYGNAIMLRPGYAEAFNNQGVALCSLSRDEEALASYGKAIALRPQYAEAFSNQAAALHCLHRDEEALASCREAVALRPDDADALLNLGTTLRDMGRRAEAEAIFRQVLALKPNDVAALNNLALAFLDLACPNEAVGLLEKSLTLAPNIAKTHIYLAQIGIAQDQMDKAEPAAQRGLALAGDDSDALFEALNTLGLIRFKQDRSDEALELYTRAINLKPDRAEIFNNIGIIHREGGRLTKAREEFEQAIQLDPSELTYYLNLADLKNFAKGDPHLAAMEKLARDPASLSPAAQARLNFALGKAYDDLGRYDDAFCCFRNANALQRAQITYDEPEIAQLFERIIAIFDSRLTRAKAGEGFRSARPVFVVGMPRSGTTLIEQILASHPLVHGAGELPNLGDLVERMAEILPGAAPFPEGVAALTPPQLQSFGQCYVEELTRLARGAERITDKMPVNFMFVGLIHLALPEARIIHVMRDPLDTCLSCFSRLFTTGQHFTYDLGELGRHYRRYTRLMEHWRRVLPVGSMLEIRYEDVLADLETEARRMVDYCALPWHPSCVSFHEARRPVRTASAGQVRQPIYWNSVERWRRYRAHLGPLLTALGIDPD